MYIYLRDIVVAKAQQWLLDKKMKNALLLGWGCRVVWHGTPNTKWQNGYQHAIIIFITHYGLETPYVWVNIGSGNGLLPDGIKPLPEPMLTYHQ